MSCVVTTLFKVQEFRALIHPNSGRQARASTKILPVTGALCLRVSEDVRGPKKTALSQVHRFTSCGDMPPNDGRFEADDHRDADWRCVCL